MKNKLLYVPPVVDLTKLACSDSFLDIVVSGGSINNMTPVDERDNGSFWG